ncbi:Uncharacterised protein [Mycobacteroides abscessus subsp. abscessus]|uniref:hypothetical protein n=1 Tax=Mycobacteroides abscessus TaxID=36809 RepID=UPI00092BE3DD|nr:hypothetical protein [Mycobacteroides abscessus]SIC06480.1 Uncharacterised protein [Mycobacteroides abscessus subsp. abscessus]
MSSTENARQDMAQLVRELDELLTRDSAGPINSQRERYDQQLVADLFSRLACPTGGHHRKDATCLCRLRSRRAMRVLHILSPTTGKRHAG